MKKRQINDEMMDSVLKTMLSEYQEEERTKDIKRDRRIKQIR
ncbi:MAG: hypothetical protein ACLUR5_14200 [Eubacterium ventriosum]